MLSMPLQVGVPGSQEMIIIVLNLVLIAAVIYAVVAVGRRLFGGSNDERVEQLEERVAELEGRRDSEE